MSDTRDERAEQLKALEERIEHGWDMLEEGRVDPVEVERWEQAWLRLLRRYDALKEADE